MEVTVFELRDIIAGGDPPVLLDVRESYEWAICRIEGSRHVPLDELPEHVRGLDPTARYVTVCHTGARARQAALWLLGEGITRVESLKGGVDAWAIHVEKGMPRY
jgi:rhodanese-related sulfurtransferase